MVQSVRIILGCFLVTLLLDSGGNSMSNASTPDSARIEASTLALFVLRSALEVPSRADSYRILPSSQHVGMDQAAKTLAHMAKPVRCQAVSQQGEIVVECTPLVRPVEIEARRSAAEHIVKALRPGNSADTNDLVLVQGTEGSSLLVHFTVIEQLLRDYDMDYGISGVTLTEPMRQRGVRAAYRVRPHTRGRPGDSPLGISSPS
jgi:hypothetical protein